MSNQIRSISIPTDSSSGQSLSEASNHVSEHLEQESSQKLRVAWLCPDMQLSFYIQPVLRELAKLFPDTTIYTGRWAGFVPGCEDTFTVEIVGKVRVIELRKTEGYSRTIQLPSLDIIPRLLQHKPQVVFVVGLSLWALLVLLLKPFLSWRVVIVYSGSSPNVDMSDSKLRLWLRRFMAKLTDAFITNSQGGKAYLTCDLKVPEQRVFARPYQIPDQQALMEPVDILPTQLENVQHPIFLYIGQTIYRKGLPYLLQACSILESQGCQNYSLMIVGDGEQKAELETWCQEHGLQERVKWLGWAKYGQLGEYHERSNVFVFPTLEDIWGMVVLEAMLFGKPVLCSKDAGAAEMIRDGKNGFIFDPQNPEKLAELMRRFIEEPDLMATMGQCSQQIMSQQDKPEMSAQNFAKIISFVMNNAY